ncbi:MAG: DUF488 domain-containing protein [Gemmatimonadaceae bacterium]|nr:DUF488 domain-containing protein [Gemmatimonadaceae bacterium]
MSPKQGGRVKHTRGKCIYSIGHSLHRIEHFTALLHRHSVDVVLDVRSSPYSRRAPQFNRQSLQQSLAAAGIKYSFGGLSLGGRPSDRAVYVGNQVDYELVAQTVSFINGVRRVGRAARHASIALLCAESDPLECHRFLLIGRALHVMGFDVQHILANGNLESHSAGEQRLLAAAGLEQIDVFSSVDDSFKLAYKRQAQRFAFAGPMPELSGDREFA